ncbi:MAG: GNAT family N-acetyltransferase [Phycisphaerae bacterium]
MNTTGQSDVRTVVAVRVPLDRSKQAADYLRSAGGGVMDTLAHFWDRLALTPPLARDDLHLVLIGKPKSTAATINFASAYGAMLYVPKAHRADVLAISAEAADAMCDYLQAWWNSNPPQKTAAVSAEIPNPPLPINYITGLADGVTAMTPRLLSMVNRKAAARKTVNIMMTLPAEKPAALSSKVRLARDGDEPVLNRWRKLYSQERGILFDADVDAWIESRNVYVHESNGAIVALAKFDLVLFTTVEIGGVFTFPEYRKQGFGAELVDDMAARIRQMGKTPLLQVDAENDPALALYQKMNWIELGRLARVWLNSAS